MKVGFFSPMPPAPTGVADYSETLLSWLRQLGAVEIAPETCDVALYHVGNNTLHREIYHRALTHPGVVVLHDAVLQHLLLGMLDANEYVEEFVYNYGETSRELGRELWEQRARSGADVRYFARPMLKRIATASRAIIVHNPAAAALVREHAPHAQVFEIPHLFQQPALPSPEETARFRAALGLKPETLLIGTFGHQRETKRLAVVLRAFQRALSEMASMPASWSPESSSPAPSKMRSPRCFGIRMSFEPGTCPSLSCGATPRPPMSASTCAIHLRRRLQELQSG